MKKYYLLYLLTLLMGGSSVVQAQLTQPTNLAAVALTSTSIRLTWTDNTTNETGFEIEQSTDGRTFTKVADAAVNATSFTVTNLNPVTAYSFRVRAKFATGNSSYSNTASATTLARPPVVTNLAATAQGTTSIRLTWTDVGKEANYFVERRTGQSGTFTRIATTTAGYTDTNLQPGTEYCYRVQFDSSVEPAGYSNIACATTQQAVPNAPARLVAQATSSTQINLQWADLSNNETGFELERASQPNGPFSKIADLGVNATSYEDKNLTPNTQYCYRVQARNGSGVSGYSNTVCAMTPAPPIPAPAAPSNLSAVAVSSSQINLNWTDNANNETGFELERSTDNRTFSKIADLQADVTSYQNTGLDPATRYYYRLRAVNQGGPSAYSNTADATTADVAPTAPARLVAQAISFSQINLQWADLSNNETRFDIERSTDGTTFTKIAEVPAGTIAYQSTGLNGSTRYFYRVRAVNAVGPSAYSNIADATTPAAPVPDAPKNLKAVPLDFDLIRLTWDPLSGNATGVTVERSTSPTTGFVEIGKQSASSPEFFDREILAIATYYYRVKATNGNGNSVYSNLARVDAEFLITGVAPKAATELPIYVAERMLYVQLAKHLAKESTLQIITMQGLPARRYQIPAGNQANWQQYLGDLASGIYLVTIETAEQRITQKVIIQ
ncbi:hypothetical protein GCM10023187_35970 [Nibrella viscosa]|uniref:Fibronectin type-III domain-containing protein n=1 Tax=Nibrella viscosa TaxID=1084524 RepID=A0ABP8KN91_9BACT